MCSSLVMALQQVSAEQVGYWMAFPMSSPPLVDAICSPKAKDGDLSTPVDDAPVKVRKPYTITKQRERWTEDEHQKFLEALKLHGRAWRRIEEHIGTKTAVQIRSHAQKFFSKLEREASLGGPLATAGSGEIEIPPPRPKRKPSRPYPKKASGAFSGSPSFEEDSQSPPAIHSAFTPLESGTVTCISKMPSKKFKSSAASLRLFGQNVVPGSDKEADADLAESTGSPRSQFSVETEDTSGISPLVSNTASGVWDQTTSVLKSHGTAGASSATNSQPSQAFSEWEKGLTAMHTPKIDHLNENNGPYISSAYESSPDASCYTPWQPSSFFLGGHPLAQISACVPTFWQGLVPPSFAHGTSEDVNTAAAITAATYAVASAWQAIQGALANASNEWAFANASNERAFANASNDSNTSIVYSPRAMLAAARQPISVSRPHSPDSHAHEHAKRKQGGSDSGSGNEDERNDAHGEESTAECCSGLTDTSRLSSYESNDEGAPAKKCRRNFHDDDMHLCEEAPDCQRILKCERISKVEKPSISSEGSDISNKNNGAVAVHSRSADDHMDRPSDKTIMDNSSVDGSLENDIAKISVHTTADQPIDLIIQACGLNSRLETDEGSLKEKGALNDSNDSDKEIVSSSTLSQPNLNKALTSKECLNRSLHDENGSQSGGNGTCIESEHLFMIKAGTTLSSRYSGVGFVPYKKSIKVGVSKQA